MSSHRHLNYTNLAVLIFLVLLWLCFQSASFADESLQSQEIKPSNDAGKSLCFSSICIGMTIQEVLQTGVVIDAVPIKYITKAQEERALKSVEKLKGISTEEKKYLAPFYLNESPSFALDSRALAILDKATRCTYFPAAIEFKSNLGFSTIARFYPLGVNMQPIVATISRVYPYSNSQIETLTEELRKQFPLGELGMGAWSSDYFSSGMGALKQPSENQLHAFPNILLLSRSDVAEVILLDKRVWQYSVRPDSGILADARDQWENQHAQNADCLNPVTIE